MPTASRKKSLKKKKSSSVRKVVRSAAKAPAMKTKNSKPIGVVTHFYGEIGVAIIKFSKKVGIGTVLKFQGATTDFENTITSMQFDHKPIMFATKGQEVGIKVKKRVREGDFAHHVK